MVDIPYPCFDDKNSQYINPNIATMPIIIPVSSTIMTYAIVRSLFDTIFPAPRFKSSSIKRDVRTALRVGSRNELKPPHIVLPPFRLKHVLCYVIVIAISTYSILGRL